jgi:nitrous oxidase accessory protein NosD
MTRSSSVVRSAVSVLFAAVVVVSVAGGLGGATPSAVDSGADAASAAPAGPVEIDECTTITEPGRYVLVTDLATRSDSCLDVAASDVVLDGGGHRLDGALAYGSVGVFVAPDDGSSDRLENVTVRNLRVRDWVFGVEFDGVTGVEVVDVTTFQTFDGVTVRDAADVTVAGVRASNCCVGVAVYDSRSVRIVDYRTSWDSSMGVSVVDSRAVQITNASISHARVGIGFLNTDDVVIKNATVTDADVGDVVVSPPLVPVDDVRTGDEEASIAESPNAGRAPSVR